MKIYVASSWRNDLQLEIVATLRAEGHEVYDFHNLRDEDHGFHWSEIDSGWRQWSSQSYREALKHPIAQAGFEYDMKALRECDAVVAVQPFGVSTSLELGWAVGAGKLTILLLAHGEPELMVKMCDYVCISMQEVKRILRRVAPSGKKGKA